ncbi:Aminotran-1-2 domain-containing protein [Aphelenchoides fujianensis]|nr:Aminotran-1-2 domain-containing protein [Aphelenchoides fujianensis]
MDAPAINKQTEVIFDILPGGRVRHRLNVGTPSKELLHRFGRLMADATRARVEREIGADDCLGGVFQYGFPVGEAAFLDALAAFLTREYAAPVNRDDLVQTNGATFALVFMLEQLFPQRAPVYVEKITYFRSLAILRGWGYETRPIRTEEDGIDVRDLERVWSRELRDADPTAAHYAAVLYITPQFHNPLGTVLSERKAREVLRLARRFNVLVISDDVYNLHSFDGTLHRRLFALDRPTDADYGKGHVVSNGSFSKIFMPALRLGWVEAGPTVRRLCFERSPITCSGGSMNTFAGGVVAEILGGPLAHEHVRRTREDAKKKMAVALETLDKHLPPACAVAHRPTGGYFVYVTLPPALDSTAVCATMRTDHGIWVNDDKLAWTGGAAGEDPDFALANGIRLCTPYVSEEHLRAALIAFCGVLSAICEERGLSPHRSAVIG